MAVIDHELAFAGSVGPHGEQGPTYHAVYKIRTDSVLDQTQVIVDYVIANIADFGDSYSYGNDTDTEAKLHAISPRKPANSDKVWLATLSYKRPGINDKKPDENGDPTDDPEQWRDEMDVQDSIFSRPVYRAKYLGGGVGTFDARRSAMDGAALPAWGPVVNSAFGVFDPPLERDDYNEIIRITKFEATYPESFNADALTVNDRDATIHKVDCDFGPTVYAKHLLLLLPCVGSCSFTNGQVIWRNTYSVIVNYRTWVDEVLDRGVSARACEDDPDGKGGTISANQVPAGAPAVRALTDPDDTPIREPVLLDGDGEPLGCGGDPVWLKYLKYDELDFDAQVPQGVLKDV